MSATRVTAVEGQLVQLREEMHAGFSELRAGDEETRRHMRVLHEDVIARLALIQEGQRLMH